MDPIVDHEIRIKRLERHRREDSTRSRGARRTVFSGTVTLYVRTDGNDSNVGTVNSAAGAFLTLTRAIAAATNEYESVSGQVVIQLAAGTWAQTATLSLNAHRCGGGVNILGDATTPGNVIVRADTNGMWLFLIQYAAPAPWFLQGLRVEGNTGINANLVLARRYGMAHLYNMEYGICGSGVQLYAVEKAMLVHATSYGIVGGATTGYHMLTNRGGFIEDGGSAINGTITNTPFFSIFAVATEGGHIRVPNVTYSAGAVTVGVKQYESNYNSIVYGTFPGSVAGTTLAGGIKM